jgi:hypothetical protein
MGYDLSDLTESTALRGPHYQDYMLQKIDDNVDVTFTIKKKKKKRYFWVFLG